MRRFFKVLVLPITLLLSLSKGVLTILTIGSLALSLATVTVSGVFSLASSAVEAVTGPRTVRAKHKTRLDELAVDNANLKASNNTLANENQRLTREAGALRKSRNATRKIARKTTRTVTRRMGRGAARSIGSAAGEAIPFIGIGVIVGGLALEVKDMCNTARDMAGLQAALAAEDDPELARQSAVDAFDCKAMIREELPGYTDLPSRETLWADIRERPAAALNGAKRYMPDLPDLSESAASWLSWVTDLACKFRPCDGQEALPE